MNKLKENKGILIFIVLLILFIVAISIFTNNFSLDLSQKQAGAIETAIKHAVVECYAVEGFYPKDIVYLEKNYNLSLNHDKYVFHYSYLGENMLPMIRVFVK